MALPKAIPRTQDNPNRHYIVQQIIDCLCEIRTNDGTKWPENLLLHLANQIHLNDHYTSSSFPTPVALASPSLSGLGRQASLKCIDPQAPGL